MAQVEEKLLGSLRWDSDLSSSASHLSLERIGEGIKPLTTR
jgi:hypothetical protein